MNEQPPPLLEPPAKPAAGLFWVALLLPPVVALTAMAMSQQTSLKGPGVTLAMINYIASTIGAAYCGVWLARRFCKPGSARVLVAIALIAGIGLLNLILTFIGCVSNSGMDMR